jgi:AcrR family transcriptional regulator
MEVDYENRILDAAKEMFQQRGIAGVTMDDVSHKAGISKKTIYEFYRSKDEIIRILATRFIKKQKKSYQDLEKASNAIEELLMLFQHFQILFDSLHPKAVYEIQKYYPEIWSIIRTHKTADLLKKIKRNLVRGIGEKLYQEGIDIDFVAKLRLQEIEIAYDPFYFSHEEYPINKITEQLFKLFLFGVVTSEVHNKYFEKFQRVAK